MAFPVHEETVATSVTMSALAHVVTLPASISTGDRLFIFYNANDGAETPSASGWTALLGPITQLTSGRLGILTRKANGAEGASVTVDWTGKVTAAYLAMRISAEHATTPPEITTAVIANSNAPNSSGLSPSWGSDDTLWLAAFMSRSANPTSYTPPTNYTSRGTQNGSGNAALAVASRALAAASEDPGAWALGAAVDWNAYTIGVRPVPTAGGGPTQAVRTHQQMQIRRAA